MVHSPAQAVKAKLIETLAKDYNVKFEDISVEIPPKTELGDLAFPIAFEAAKRIKAVTGEKKNPREIAASLSDVLKSIPGVEKVEIAGPGYLNVFLDRASMFSQALDETADRYKTGKLGKIIVEHTSVNPNKAAHIGHVRNAVLGDATARILREAGDSVEIHNYIDNTGVQVADVVVGFMHIESKSLDEIKKIAEESARFDYYCWDLYSKVGSWYEEDKSRTQIRANTLHEIEEGNNHTADIAEYISSFIVDCHLDTMSRLDISYDLLAREKEILHLNFWQTAFEKLKATGVITYEDEGRSKGCWVMKSDEGGESQSNEESEHDADKIIVRSNGTVTYTGKDIAYHLWKLGKLGLDFNYKFLRTDHRGHDVWVSTSDKSEAQSDHPSFGNGTAFLNVIDVGQSYPQAIVKRGVIAVDHDERVERSAHLAYEKVTLTPGAAKELGAELSESDLQRQQIGMSGRKGLGVKADDLIDKLEENALAEVTSRHQELSSDEQQEIAHKIAVAALRYFILKYTRTSIIAFDFKEAMSFDGETGPYIQYAAVRANNIFRKLGRTPQELTSEFKKLTADDIRNIFTGEAGDNLWSLVYFAIRFDDVIQTSAATFEPTHTAKYAFQLAKQFNLFYHSFHILSEENETKRLVLLMIANLVRKTLERALRLLGIEVPERM